MLLLAVETCCQKQCTGSHRQFLLSFILCLRNNSDISESFICPQDLFPEPLHIGLVVSDTSTPDSWRVLLICWTAVREIFFIRFHNNTVCSYSMMDHYLGIIAAASTKHWHFCKSNTVSCEHCAWQETEPSRSVKHSCQRELEWKESCKATADLCSEIWQIYTVRQIWKDVWSIFRKVKREGERGGTPSETGGMLSVFCITSEAQLSPWKIRGPGKKIIYHSWREKICFRRISNKFIKWEQVDRQMEGEEAGNINKT